MTEYVFYCDAGKPKLISNDLKTCRRVIIILTPELFKDEWGVFQILQVRVQLNMNSARTHPVHIIHEVSEISLKCLGGYQKHSNGYYGYNAYIF